LPEFNVVDQLIRPEIFSREVKAFFTRKSLGANAGMIGNLLSISEQDIYIPVQRHTDRVLVLGADQAPVTADAVISQRKRLLLGVRVADCVPILLHDRRKSVVGAVHAGWRGTASQIIMKTVRSMVELFDSSPKDIIAAIGPSIRWQCYEVGNEVKEAVCEATGEGNYCISRKDKCFIDLSSANRIQALSSGIPGENIWSSPECTRCNPDEFHSYRYSRRYTGSQGGFIGVF
jgi:YfiH family protein